MNPKKLMKFALDTGALMLKSGAETYRVENTIIRILNTSGYETTEAFATITGIFATIDDEKIEMITQVKRITNRAINLKKIELANDLSRRFCDGLIELDDAIMELERINKTIPYNVFFQGFSVSFAASSFTVVLGGGVGDFFSSLISGIALSLFLIYVKNYNFSRIFNDLIGAIIVGIIALFLTKEVHLSSNLDLVIIGGVMPLVPGVAITNAVIDTISGELLSGMSRAIEALIIAISLAAGIGVVLKLFVLFGGII